MPRRSPKPAVEPAFATSAADAQRSAVLVMVALAPLVYAREALEPFAIAKLVVVAIAVVVVVAAQAVRIFVLARIRVTWSLAGVVIACLGIALVVATTQAGWRTSSVLGAHGRDSGLVLYTSCLLTFAVILARFDRRRLEHLVISFLCGAALLALLTVLQRLGSDLAPFEVVEQLTGKNGTMANPNFASGYLGIALPLVVWTWSGAKGLAGRIAAALLAVLLVAGLVSTNSIQGFAAAATGLAVAFAISLLGPRPGGRRILVPLMAAGTLFAAVLVIPGLLGEGPLSMLGQGTAFSARRAFWAAAMGMWSDNPVFGVGLDQYSGWYRAYRPVEQVLSTRIGIQNDAAHSVPLMMLSGGGLLLGIAYLTFIGFVGWRVVSALTTLDRRSAPLVGAVTGGWIAYHVQSLVSIDVPPLAVAHFVLAGVLVALTGGLDWREVTLPWRRMATDRRRRGAFQWTAAVVSVCVVVAGIAFALRPLRADIAAGRGERLLASEQHAESIAVLEDAVALQPGRARYHIQLGRALYGAERLEDAEIAFTTAVELEPRDFDALLWAARAAGRQGDVDSAEAWYERALEVEPLHPQLKLEVARLAAAEGDEDEARKYIEEGLSIAPDDAALLEFLDTLAAGTSGASDE